MDFKSEGKVSKNSVGKIFLAVTLFLFGVLNCSSPDEPEKAENKDGSITVNISANDDARGRKVYIKLFDKDTDVYDPHAVALDDTNFTLDMSSKGSIRLSYNASGGEFYQISGAIDMAGLQYLLPDAGDYLFSTNTAKINGDMTVNIGKADLDVFTTISGGVSFREARTGAHLVRIWEADNRTGTESLGWIGDVDNMIFRFNGTNGAIGRVGKRYVRKYVDDVDDYVTNVHADISFTGDGKYYFCIYGWVYSGLDWNSSEIKHEFYVIQDYNRKESDPLIGSLTVDGIEYDMHKYDFGGGSFRFKAVRKTDLKKTGPVNMKPFFEYWRKNGMENYYLDELTWAIELLYGRMDGTFILWNIDIPSL